MKIITLVDTSLKDKHPISIVEKNIDYSGLAVQQSEDINIEVKLPKKISTDLSTKRYKMTDETANPKSLNNFKCKIEEDNGNNGFGEEPCALEEDNHFKQNQSDEEEPYIKDTDVNVMILDENSDVNSVPTEADIIIKEEVNPIEEEVKHIKEEIKTEPIEYEELMINDENLNKLNKKKKKGIKYEKFYTCKLCDLTFSRNDAIAHKLEHPEAKCFACELCQKLFRKINSLDKHVTRHNGGMITCNICAKKFSSNASFKNHQSIHTGEKPYQCDICYRSFRQIVPLRVHQRIHTGEKPYHCVECDKRFRAPGDFEMHKRIHTGYKPYQCKVCAKKFTLKQGMKRHEERHYKKLGDNTRPYQCDDCGKFFKEPVYLRRHKKIHLIELGLLTREETVRRTFVCDVDGCNCERVFLSNSSLKRHRLIIKGEKNFFCDICGKGFITQDYLKKHAKCHDQDTEKRHKCKDCGKLFAIKQHLDRHKVKHLTERPSFHCGVCNKPFLTEFYVKKHSMKQHGTYEKK